MNDSAISRYIRGKEAASFGKNLWAVTISVLW